MSLWRLILRSLLHYRWTGAAVVFGVAVATTAITGALLVGDSVRASLRRSALARLGGTQAVLAAPRFFRAELAPDLGRTLPLPPGGLAVAFIQVPGAVTPADKEGGAPQANILGVDDGFWTLCGETAPVPLEGFRCALNQPLADDLGVRTGDSVFVNLAKPTLVPEGSLFAQRKQKKVQSSLRLEVAAVLPATGAGGFALAGGPSTPRNLFLARERLAAKLDKTGMANALALAWPDSVQGTPEERWAEALKSACTLRDYGLQLTPNAAQNYISLESTGLVLRDAETRAAQSAAAECGGRAARTSVYLADTLTVEGRSSAYAILAGVEPLAPFSFQAGGGATPGPDGIWLNEWLAQDLGAQVGQSLKLEYPVATHSGIYHLGKATFTVRGIVSLDGPGADRGLTPLLEGITHAKKISDWNPPFPVDMKRVTKRDDLYWDKYQATPKAFVDLDAMRGFWQGGPEGAQADWVTSVRVVPAGGEALAAFAARFEKALVARLAPADAGLLLRPVRRLAIEGAEGTSDFSELFLSLSFFIVAAAAGLAGALMRLLAERRAGEAGLLLACGLRTGQVRTSILGESAFLALAGAGLGVPGGLLYAAGLLHGLTTFWSGALGPRALELAVTGEALAGGGLAGFVIGFLSAVWGTRTLLRRPLLELLAGWRALDILAMLTPRGARIRVWVYGALGGTLLAASLALLLLARFTDKVPATPAFFGSGAALLLAGLCGAWLLLHFILRGSSGVAWVRLALRNAAAQRGRSLLALGLLAAASFVLVAVAANQRDFGGGDLTRRDAGSGGFALRAITALPVLFDPDTPEGRERLGFDPKDEPLFRDAHIYSFLVSPGEDISCLNIARPSQPRVLGVRGQMMKRGGFSVRTVQDQPPANPWSLLDRERDAQGATPSFGDAASVQWTLHSGLGETYALHDASGRETPLRFEGVLAGSIFASELLVSEANLRRLFPDAGGPRYFLVEALPGEQDAVARALRKNLADWGVEVRPTREILRALGAVQNTYLAMFLALGGLGVLLGSVGLLAVLLRSAFERRGELALLQALGIGRGAVAGLLLLEHAGLLVAGLALGTAAALLAVAPALASADVHADWSALAAWLGGILTLGLLGCAAAAVAAVPRETVVALRAE